MKLNGDGKEPSHLSAKLSLAFPFQLGADWSLLVHFTISITSRSDSKYSRVLGGLLSTAVGCVRRSSSPHVSLSEGFEEFSRQSICWGYDNHTPISMIEDSCRGLLVEDTLAVEVVVRAKLADGGDGDR